MPLFVGYIAAKQIIRPRSQHAGGIALEGFESTGTRVTEAIHGLVKRAIESGDIRPDLDPLDLLRALAGASNVASTPDWPQSALGVGAHSHCRLAADHVDRCL